MAIKSKIKTTKARLVNKDIVKIAGIQMASGPDIKSNLNEAENLITIAANQGAKLIALPEYFSIMSYKDSEKLKAKEKPDHGLVQSFLSKQAKKNKVWIIGGSIPLVSKDKNKIRNSCLIYDDKGNLVHRYDKIHLFGFDMGEEFYREDKLIEAGSDVVVVDSPFGKIGIAICYDLRFPELFRAMKENRPSSNSISFYRHDRKGSLGNSDSSKSYRESMLCVSACSGWLSPIWKRNTW